MEAACSNEMFSGIYPTRSRQQVSKPLKHARRAHTLAVLSAGTILYCWNEACSWSNPPGNILLCEEYHSSDT